MKQRNFLLLCIGISFSAWAANESPAPTVKDNQELPKILYVVPWKEAEDKKISNPKLVLHNFIGDLYEPQIASDWLTD